MDVYKIRGGKRLQGKVTVSGAKNSAVALIPASILAGSTVTIGGIPEISDAWTLKALLEEIGGEVSFENGQMTIDPTKMVAMPLPNGNVKKLRASYYMMGAMLGRFKQAVIGLPGGCFLGPRPIDQHIKGFEALGAKVTNEHGAIYLRAEELIGAKIYLDVASVGATINIMLAAVRAKGKTVIENAAKEPEIIDVATLLTNMGAKIKGAGTSVIRIEGVDELRGTNHTIIPDIFVNSCNLQRLPDLLLTCGRVGNPDILQDCAAEEPAALEAGAQVLAQRGLVHIDHSVLVVEHRAGLRRLESQHQAKQSGLAAA